MDKINQHDVQQLEQQMQEQEQINAIMDKFLSPEANQRLKRIRMVNPDKAQSISLTIIRGIQSGGIRTTVDEGYIMKLMAESTSQASHIEIKGSSSSGVSNVYGIDLDDSDSDW